jgi:hypothetical protein
MLTDGVCCSIEGALNYLKNISSPYLTVLLRSVFKRDKVLQYVFFYKSTKHNLLFQGPNHISETHVEFFPDDRKAQNSDRRTQIRMFKEPASSKTSKRTPMI